MQNMKKIILASGSPWRQQLLRMLIGDNFDVIKSSYEEDNSLQLAPKELTLYHAKNKGRDVAGQLEKGIVIAADTIAFYNDEVLGKPHTENKAKETLSKLSGNTIEAITGLVVIDAETKQEISDIETTRVKFKQFTEKEINDYVKTGEPLDKAGAFAILGRAGIFIERVDGCFFNIVGLPLFKLNKALNELGVSIFDFTCQD